MTTVEPNTQPAPDRMAQFDGQNGKFQGGRKVHTVCAQPWINGQQVAAPACRTGAASFDPDVFQPTGHDVDCDKCLALPNPPVPIPSTPDVRQLALALDSAKLDELIARSSVGDEIGLKLALRASPDRVDALMRRIRSEHADMVTLRPDPAYL